MEILTRYREALVDAMDSLLGGPPSPILTMCRYHLGLADLDGTPTRQAAGKMLRPALCLAMCEALDGDISRCLPVALSLEVTHRTSLIFDDIQDRSPQRNHRPTVWGVWGADQAINAGLALSCYARLALHGMLDRQVPHDIFVEMHRLLEQTVIDLCRGQYLDLCYQSEVPNLEQYLEVVRLKTGVLLGTACEVGALVAGAGAKREAARRFGEAIGVAFQLRDDILGVWGQTSIAGKSARDLEERKPSLPVVLASTLDTRVADFLSRPRDDAAATAALHSAVDSSLVRDECEARLWDAAQNTLEALIGLELSNPWNTRLRVLAGFVVERNV